MYDYMAMLWTRWLGSRRINHYINGVESEVIGVCDEYVEFVPLPVPHVPHHTAEMVLHLCCHGALHCAHTQ